MPEENTVSTSVDVPAAEAAPVVDAPAVDAPVEAPADPAPAAPRSLADIEADIKQTMADLATWGSGDYEAAKATALAEFEAGWAALKDAKTSVIQDLADELNAAHSWWSNEIDKLKSVF